MLSVSEWEIASSFAVPAYKNNILFCNTLNFLLSAFCWRESDYDNCIAQSWCYQRVFIHFKTVFFPFGIYAVFF
jgi:hypothetical protein